jgi:hypothetical protein
MRLLASESLVRVCRLRRRDRLERLLGRFADESVRIVPRFLQHRDCGAGRRPKFTEDFGGVPPQNRLLSPFGFR